MDYGREYAACCARLRNENCFNAHEVALQVKVNNTPKAYAALADAAGVKAHELAEAQHIGSRLERMGRPKSDFLAQYQRLG